MNNNMPVAPTLEVVDGKVMTTSLVVAEYFGKRHDNILRAIRTLDCSEEFCALNFEGTKYEIKKGEARDMFRMTKDGFTFLVMGFTGKLAAEFKEAYINEFNRMQEQLANQGLPFWNKASIPPHDKFLEKMVVEAGRGNRYAAEILQLKYELSPLQSKRYRCPECQTIISSATAEEVPKLK
ncbi:Rha family transcriptional regulator [Vibrio vulnificus]|uniref:Rha family transcriptional regulator n=1 Tax=Vibrio vulnificus TaxID=672 RepID=UPI00034B9349|nr:Rha family transcriptional regulator [Vibrio vulnificus]NHE85615.1 Rha family transcriptional regulator [Vibrio vulnificus]POC53544.1 hypothetical protein CRN45_05455 [Vibrio vulnificus]POC63507.1 hypothetical protein CRN44_11855 [Vibrio vulnificus]